MGVHMNNEAVLQEELKFIIWTSLKHYTYLGIKRIVDIVLSLIGCVFLMPIIIIIKLITVISGDLNPIIFSQSRIGKKGKEFKF